MMGHKPFAPKLFHRLSLEKMVPQDDLIRRLEAVVDLAFVRDFPLKYKHTPPAVLGRNAPLRGAVGYSLGIVGPPGILLCRMHTDMFRPKHSALNQCASYGTSNTSTSPTPVVPPNPLTIAV